MARTVRSRVAVMLEGFSADGRLANIARSSLPRRVSWPHVPPFHFSDYVFPTEDNQARAVCKAHSESPMADICRAAGARGGSAGVCARRRAVHQQRDAFRAQSRPHTTTREHGSVNHADPEPCAAGGPRGRARADRCACSGAVMWHVSIGRAIR